jgi:hypothetical protein
MLDAFHFNPAQIRGKKHVIEDPKELKRIKCK